MDQSAVTDVGAQQPLRFEDYEKMCHWLTRRVIVGQRANGRRMEYDDVFQEMALLWCKCRDGFDPSRGFKFSTYFVRAARLQWQNLRRGLLGNHAELTDSLQDTFQGEEGEYERSDMVQDYTATNPELAAIRSEAVRLECDLNPLLDKLTRLAVKPPDLIAMHLDAIKDQHLWAETLGVKMPERPPEAMTTTMVRDLFHLNWRHRLLLKPVRGLIEEMP